MEQPNSENTASAPKWLHITQRAFFITKNKYINPDHIVKIEFEKRAVRWLFKLGIIFMLIFAASLFLSLVVSAVSVFFALFYEFGFYILVIPASVGCGCILLSFIVGKKKCVIFLDTKEQIFMPGIDTQVKFDEFYEQIKRRLEAHTVYQILEEIEKK